MRIIKGILSNLFGFIKSDIVSIRDYNLDDIKAIFKIFIKDMKEDWMQQKNKKISIVFYVIMLLVGLFMFSLLNDIGLWEFLGGIGL